VKRRDLPNLITLVRIALVAPLAWALLNGAYGWGVTLFLMAAVSDGVDGFLARHYSWQSRLGAVLDPIADKLLLVTVYFALGINGFVPFWLVAAVIFRDFIIIIGAGAYRIIVGSLEVAPTSLSKLNTILQVVLAVVAILAHGLGYLPDWSADILVYAVLASTVFSGLHYVALWGRRAWQGKTRNQNE
jgi:cardiolipin synthase